MRNAIKSGAQNAVFVSPREVYTRDNWTCHICGLGIPEELRINRRIEVAGYNPLSPTLDHVVPCKLGGDHTLENLKAAHHSCNAKKSFAEITVDDIAVTATIVVAPEDRCAVDGCPLPRHTRHADGTYTGKNRNKMCRGHNRRVCKGSGDPLKAQCHCGCKQLIAVAPDQFGIMFIDGHSANRNRTPTAAEQLATNFVERNGCKIWSGTLHRGGYGVVQLGNRQDKRSKLVHRVAYQLAHGEESVNGLVVDHLCGNKACYNINHLEAVTHAENIRRAHQGRGVKRTA